MNKIVIFLALFATASLSGCASYDFSQRIVQQGNLLPQKKVSQLSIGMSKQQVAQLLGSSLIGPTFNQNRWDYAYTYAKGNKTLEQKRLVLFFRNGNLRKIQR